MFRILILKLNELIHLGNKFFDLQVGYLTGTPFDDSHTYLTMEKAASVYGTSVRQFQRFHQLCLLKHVYVGGTPLFDARALADDVRNNRLDTRSRKNRCNCKK